jgi:DNA-binding CsgD family transcriptional regulator
VAILENFQSADGTNAIPTQVRGCIARSIATTTQKAQDGDHWRIRPEPSDCRLAYDRVPDAARLYRCGTRLTQEASALFGTLSIAMPHAATLAHVRALQASRRGDPSVTEHALKATRQYEALGWSSHVDRCRDLSRSGSGAARVTKGAIEGFSLSPREKEIAELVVAGASNTAMAECLAVSRRTVEKHLTSIYEKLRLRNRAQLVAFMSRRRSSPG